MCRRNNSFPIFATNLVMGKKFQIRFVALATLVLLATTSCHKQEKYAELPLVGHWGCEQYISCRTDSTGFEQWDTLQYEVGDGHGYEVYFNADGSGKLLLNDSPAVIKKYTCSFDYDSISQVLTIYNTSWIISVFSDATSADMSIEEMTDNHITASWANHFSEPTPFFERFFLKRID